MSKSLSIEHEWLDQPLARDPIDRQTWARLSLKVGGRMVTRLLDRKTGTERSSLYVPAFPIADWIARNWWLLLWEPLRGSSVPPNSSWSSPAQREWIQRHCFRTAESGLLLPRFFLFNDGRGVIAEWFADPPHAYPHMPGQFLEAGQTHLDLPEVQDGLKDFLSAVVARLDGVEDDRVSLLRKNWEAITSSDPEVVSFCRAAGILGINPYEIADIDQKVIDFLEKGLGEEPESPIVTDLLEAAETTQILETWRWVDNTCRAHGLKAREPSPAISGMTAETPHEMGYQLARLARVKLGEDKGEALRSLHEVEDRLGVGPITLENHNHLPSKSVKAVVGWTPERGALLVGPDQDEREAHMRFLEARALYHVVAACCSGPRLITSAHTWHQQASRAFAAELLAPQFAIVKRVEETGETQELEDMIQSMAQEYVVSRMVIEHQLSNAGFNLADY